MKNHVHRAYGAKRVHDKIKHAFLEEHKTVVKGIKAQSQKVQLKKEVF